jgi:hypothetical protein
VKTRAVAELDGRIDALAGGGRDRLFGLQRGRGVVFSVDLSSEAGGAVRELSASERDPFALVVRAGSPVWASRDGVFVCDPDGHARQKLAEGEAIRALGAGPHGIVFADESALFRMEWPSAAKPVRLATGVAADEVLATDEAVVWIDRGAGSVWSFDLASGDRKELARTQRKPHDLALGSDGHSVFWHEGEADLMPGREPRAFLADTVSGALRELPGVYDSSSHYVVQRACVFGPARCKSLLRVDWMRLDSGEGDGPVAEDARSFYWVGAVGDGGSRWRISGASKGVCCP